MAFNSSCNSNENYDEDEFDDSEIYELSRSYEAIINTCSEKYEFVTKVLCAYNVFIKKQNKVKGNENL